MESDGESRCGCSCCLLFLMGKFYATLYAVDQVETENTKKFWSNVLEEVRQMESNAYVYGLALYIKDR